MTIAEGNYNNSFSAIYSKAIAIFLSKSTLLECGIFFAKAIAFEFVMAMETFVQL